MAGYLMKKNSSERLKVIDNHADFMKFHEKIETITHLDGDKIIAEMEKDGFKTMNPHTNAILGIYVISYARMEMDKLWTQIQEENNFDVQLVQIDTDAIYFIKGKDTPDPESRMGFAWGRLKKEHDGDCQVFASLGPKRWAMRYLSEHLEILEDTKCCGVSLKQISCKDINSESFLQLLTEHKKELRVRQVQNMQTLSKSGEMAREPCWAVKQLVFDRHSDRRVFIENLFKTVAFGHSEEQLNSQFKESSRPSMSSNANEDSGHNPKIKGKGQGKKSVRSSEDPSLEPSIVDSYEEEDKVFDKDSSSNDFLVDNLQVNVVGVGKSNLPLEYASITSKLKKRKGGENNKDKPPAKKLSL